MAIAKPDYKNPDRKIVDRLAILPEEHLEEISFDTTYELCDAEIAQFLISDYMQLRLGKQICSNISGDYENSKKIIKRFEGLCHILCDLITIVGHNSEVIKQITSGNATLEQLQMIEELSIKQHILDLLSMIERILLALFKIFPSSVLSSQEQKKFLNVDSLGKRYIHESILEKIFERMTTNEYVDLMFMEIRKSNRTKPFNHCHTTLIFKTLEKEKPLYNFFDANYGFFQSENVKDIAKVINVVLLNSWYSKEYTDLGVIRPKPILQRSRIDCTLIERYKQKD